MTDDAKAAKNRRLAEALRANLKRRKAAAGVVSAETASAREHGSRNRTEAETVAGRDGGTD